MALHKQREVLPEEQLEQEQGEPSGVREAKDLAGGIR